MRNLKSVPALSGRTSKTSKAGRTSSAARTIISTLWSKPSGTVSQIILISWIVVCLISLVWTPYDLLHQEGDHILSAPSWAHPLGTDGAGADILSWLMRGGVSELVIVFLVAAFTFLLGCAGTALTVSSRPAVSALSRVLLDLVISIPTIVIAMVVAVPLGKSLAIVIIACSLAYSFNLMRIVRPQAVLAARSDYALASRWAGEGDWGVFRKHVLPTILPTMAVQISHSAGTAILAEVGLTYLGIGVPADIPSWGHSLQTSSQLISVYPMTVVWSGLAVTLMVAAVNIFGDCLREACDPVASPALRQAVGQEVTHGSFDC